MLRSALFSDLTQRKIVVSYRRFGRTYPSHLQRWRSQSCPPYTNLLIPFSISSVSCFSFPFTLMFCSFVSLILFFVFLEFQLCIFFCFKFSFLRLVVALFPVQFYLRAALSSSTSFPSPSSLTFHQPYFLASWWDHHLLHHALYKLPT